MTPTVGRVVHYHRAGRPDAPPQAAIITAVSDDPEDGSMPPVALAVLDDVHACTRFLTGVPFTHVPKPGTWSWPPRV
ncbi:hypothetical protein SEA_EDUGATOR_3 [Mycobacterium phage Edugator]|uniref:Uncharacterized protein n=3 Tax=Kratiovirus larva TaxID=1056831 RepID=A0A221J735_9CAUD|nr:hypothetical protein SEA_ALLEYCAT_3 [Mycobacterium phage AlleyCat]ASR85701.1 hypothetical protein SEA_EDUGATOR_3 [Mycobacterium phage Edugator]QQV92609.1 hypothetical protein SEA_PSYCHO_3 [Mycobacterium phage Psycho]WAB09685.1 hypothetical protein SEA_DADOSKY_3 [Mycobacterium phage Dadosky]